MRERRLRGAGGGGRHGRRGACAAGSARGRERCERLVGRRGDARGQAGRGQAGAGGGRAGGDRSLDDVEVGRIEGAVELGGLLVLALDRLVDLFAVDSDAGRGGDAQADLVAADIDDGDFDLVADHDCFVALTGEHQHRRLLPWQRACAPRWRFLWRARGGRGRLSLHPLFSLTLTKLGRARPRGGPPGGRAGGGGGGSPRPAAGGRAGGGGVGGVVVLFFRGEDHLLGLAGERVDDEGALEVARQLA